MHEPERWPVSNAETWWSWRDYLDRVEDLPNIATLKREADREIARILRCAGDRWQPRKPSLIPERVGNGGGGLTDAEPVSYLADPFDEAPIGQLRM